MARLGDVCTIVSGSTPRSNVPEYWDGDIKWITPAELNEETYIINDSVRHITELGVVKTGLKPFPQGTVILSSRAPIGKTAIAGCEMYCNQGFKNLICSDRINPRYLYWFLTCNTEYLNSLGRGATFKEISKEIVANIEIPLPAMEYQTAIAEKFEKISELIALRKEQLAKLDRLVKSRFVELFCDKYETRALESVCEELFAGGDVKKDIYSDIQSEEHPYPIYTNGEKNNGLYGYTSKARVTKEAVTISGRGTIGFTCLRKEPFYPAVRLIVAVPNQELVSGCYLQHFIQSKNYGGQGASIPQLTVPMIKDELIPVPPMELQNQFATFVEQADKSKLAIQQSLDKLETLKKSLMQEYFG